jgi:hypothetical protein
MATFDELQLLLALASAYFTLTKRDVDSLGRYNFNDNEFATWVKNSMADPDKTSIYAFLIEPKNMPVKSIVDSISAVNKTPQVGEAVNDFFNKLLNITNFNVLEAKAQFDARNNRPGSSANKTQFGGGNFTVTEQQQINHMANLLKQNIDIPVPASTDIPAWAKLHEAAYKQLNNGAAATSAATYPNAYEIKLNGRKIEVYQNGELVTDYTVGCEKMGVKTSAGNCGALIKKCHNGRTCVAELLNIDSDDDLLSQAELHKINPTHIRTFLYDVKYPLVEVRDTSKRSVVRSFGTYEEFLSHNSDIRTLLDGTTDVNKKMRIKNLFESLANYINKNYAGLLNPSDMYKPMGKESDVARKPFSLKYPMEPRGSPGAMTSLLGPSLAARTASWAKTALLPVGSYGFPMASFIGRPMRGGRPIPNSGFASQTEAIAEYYNNGITSLKTSLANLGKELDSKSAQQIEARLKAYNEAAKQLADDYKTMHEYVLTNYRVRDQDLDPSIEQMKSFSKRYQDSASNFTNAESRVLGVIVKMQDLLAQTGAKLQDRQVVNY